MDDSDIQVWLGQNRAQMEHEMKWETNADSYAIDRCQNCGYRVTQKKMLPARRWRGSTQGDCVYLFMRALVVVGILVWAIDCMTKMYINLGPERRWMFYLVLIEGIVVMVGGGLFLFWSSVEED